MRKQSNKYYYDDGIKRLHVHMLGRGFDIHIYIYIYISKAHAEILQ